MTPEVKVGGQAGETIMIARGGIVEGKQEIEMNQSMVENMEGSVVNMTAQGGHQVCDTSSLECVYLFFS